MGDWWTTPIPKMAPAPPVAVEDAVRASARKHGVDEGLALSVAQQESGLKQEARSPKGAIGVMQLMPDTALELGVDPQDATQNIEGGVRYLKQMLEKYNGDTRKALTAYNAGMGRVDSGGPLPKETQDYVPSVINRAGATKTEPPKPTPKVADWWESGDAKSGAEWWQSESGVQEPVAPIAVKAESALDKVRRWGRGSAGPGYVEAQNEKMKKLGSVFTGPGTLAEAWRKENATPWKPPSIEDYKKGAPPPPELPSIWSQPPVANLTNLGLHEQFTDPASRGRVLGATEFVSGLTSPVNLAMMGGLGFLKSAIAHRLIAAGFSFEMLKGAAQAIPEVNKAFVENRIQDGWQMLTEAALSGALGTGLAWRALRRTPPAPGTPTPPPTGTPGAPTAPRRPPGGPGGAPTPTPAVAPTAPPLAAAKGRVAARKAKLTPPATPAPTAPAGLAVGDIFETGDARYEILSTDPAKTQVRVTNLGDPTQAKLAEVATPEVLAEITAKDSPYRRVAPEPAPVTAPASVAPAGKTAAEAKGFFAGLGKGLAPKGFAMLKAELAKMGEIKYEKPAAIDLIKTDPRIVWEDNGDGTITVKGIKGEGSAPLAPEVAPPSPEGLASPLPPTRVLLKPAGAAPEAPLDRVAAFRNPAGTYASFGEDTTGVQYRFTGSKGTREGAMPRAEWDRMAEEGERVAPPRTPAEAAEVAEALRTPPAPEWTDENGARYKALDQYDPGDAQVQVRYELTDTEGNIIDGEMPRRAWDDHAVKAKGAEQVAPEPPAPARPRETAPDKIGDTVTAGGKKYEIVGFDDSGVPMLVPKPWGRVEGESVEAFEARVAKGRPPEPPPEAGPAVAKPTGPPEPAPGGAGVAPEIPPAPKFGKSPEEKVAKRKFDIQERARVIKAQEKTEADLAKTRIQESRDAAKQQKEAESAQKEAEKQQEVEAKAQEEAAIAERKAKIMRMPPEEVQQGIAEAIKQLPDEQLREMAAAQELPKPGKPGEPEQALSPTAEVVADELAARRAKLEQSMSDASRRADEAAARRAEPPPQVDEFSQEVGPTVVEMPQTAPPRVATPVVREPWEMTQTEYAGEAVGTKERLERSLRRVDHRKLVNQAFLEGKPVPAEVLADYPDLAPSPKPTLAKGVPEPIIAYHGTADFRGFGVPETRLGGLQRPHAIPGETESNKAIWFTENQRQAQQYANRASGPPGWLRPGARILERELRLENPLIVDMNDSLWSPKTQEHKEWSVKATDTGKVVHEIGFIKEKAIRLARQEGRGGVIFLNGYDNLPARSGRIIAVFSPDQIKETSPLPDLAPPPAPATATAPPGVAALADVAGGGARGAGAGKGIVTFGKPASYNKRTEIKAKVGEEWDAPELTIREEFPKTNKYRVEHQYYGSSTEGEKFPKQMTEVLGRGLSLKEAKALAIESLGRVTAQEGGGKLTFAPRPAAAPIEVGAAGPERGMAAAAARATKQPPPEAGALVATERAKRFSAMTDKQLAAIGDSGSATLVAREAARTERLRREGLPPVEPPLQAASARATKAVAARKAKLTPAPVTEGALGTPPKEAPSPTGAERLRKARGPEERGSFSLKPQKPDVLKERPTPRLRNKDSWLTGIRKGVSRPIDRIAEEGRAGAELAQRLSDARNLGERDAAKRLNSLREAEFSNLTKEELWQVHDHMQGIAPATSPRAIAVAQAAKRGFDEIISEVIATNATVRLRSGKTRPVAARRHYFPQNMASEEQLSKGPVRQDVIENITRRKLARTPEIAAEAIDGFVDYLDTGNPHATTIQMLLNTGQAKTKIQAISILRNMHKKFVTRDPNLEYVREVNLPFYDPNPARVLPDALLHQSLGAKRIKLLGQNNIRVDELIDTIVSERGDAEYVRHAVGRILGTIKEPDQSLARTALVLRAIGALKMTTSAIRNVTQGPLTTWIAGDFKAMVAGAKHFTPQGRKFGHESGAAIESVIHEVMRSHGAETKFVGEYLRLIQMTSTESWNRWGSSVGGADFVARMHQRLRQNPGDARARQKLKLYGLDPDQAILKPVLDYDELLMAGKLFSDRTQGRSGVQDLPLPASTSWGRLVIQFKPYSYNLGKMLSEEIYREAKAGRYGPAFGSLMVALTVLPLAEEGYQRIRDVITGRTPKEDGYLAAYLTRAINASLLGPASDAFQAARFGRLAEWTIGAVPASIVRGVEEATKGAEAFKKWAYREIPILGNLTYNRLFPRKTSSTGSKIRKTY